MYVEIDFESEDALYIQLRNQIVLGIANCVLREGDTLPPVRQMAGEIGINMHTVSKAYALLREEGYVNIDRRRGAVICVDTDRVRAQGGFAERMKLLLAEAVCRGIPREEIHRTVERLLDELGG